MNELIIVGGGSGIDEFMLPIAKREISSADFVIAGKRFIEFIDRSDVYEFGNIEATINLIGELIKRGTVAVVVSGDPLMYSFCKTAKDRLADIKMRIVPSVGSLQIIGAKFGITMENAKILSVHGRDVSNGKIAMAVYENETVFFLCSAKNSPSYICKVLLEYGLDDVDVFVGANLTYADEVLDSGFCVDIANRTYPPLCVAIVRNKNPKICQRKAFLKDTDFIRNKSPMTKEEVRAVVLSKLCTKEADISWDLGAGTGSISIELARACPFGKVYAVEKNSAAIEVLYKNKEKFMVDNLTICEGNIKDIIADLPLPDVVFIGGSGGELRYIFELLNSLNKKIRVVITAVTIETQSIAYDLMKDMDDFEAIQMSISRGKKIGNYTVFEGNNPVVIFSANTNYGGKI